MPAPSITPAPPAPLRTDNPATFNSRAEAFVDWLASAPAEFNALGLYLQALESGTLSAKLAAIDALTWAANKFLYLTSENSVATADLTAAGRALLDDADDAAQRNTLSVYSKAEVDGLVLASLYTDAMARAAVGRNISFFFTSTPTASEKLLIFVACQSITLADDFAGSTCSVGTNPAASFDLTVKKNGVAVGTITIGTGGAVTFVTSGTTVVLASGDRLTVTAPASADAAIADVAITFKGTL